MTIRLNIASRRLHRLLGTVGDDAFFALCWAAHAFQSGRAKQAARFFQFPAIAVGNIRTCKAPIFPWAIETLLNELLVAEKNFGVWPRMAARSFYGIAEASDALATVEDLAHATLPTEARGFSMLGRISQRQFEWQRGDISLPMLYRSHYLYGGELFQAHFWDKHNLPLEEFSYACFIIYLLSQEAPYFVSPENVERFGLGRETPRAVLDLISLPISDARLKAPTMRANGNDPAYKPSIFRQCPVIRFEEFYTAPLPGLIMRRATSGLFYDLAGANGAIRNEVAARFEGYCRLLLSSMLTPLEISPEFKYRLRGQWMRSPDVIASEQGKIRLIIECKAARMPVPARFAAKPQLADAGGYKELAHGVFQIWRFVSHSRLGVTKNSQCSPGVVGLVVTLDTWLSMAREATEEVFALARREADAYGGIEAHDRVSIAFTSVEDLESALALSTPKQFLQCVEAASTQEFRYWILPSIRRRIAKPLRKQRPYPLKASIGDVVPWWDKIDELRPR